MKIFLFLLGYVKIQMKGKEISRFLRLCSTHHILLWDMTPAKEDEISFFMLARDVFSLHPFLRKTNCRFRILEKRGVPFWIKKYKWKLAFWVSILLAALLFWYLSSFIWKVQLTGNSYITESMMVHFLEEQQSSVGCSIREIDTVALEDALRETFPQVIWTSIYIKGTVLHITIKEQIQLETKSVQETAVCSNLVSPCDGQVEQLFVRSGTAAVAVGDTVKQGDVLIYGWLPIYDDTGSVIQSYEEVIADGDVMVGSTYPYEDTLPLRYQAKEWTGKTLSYLTIGIRQGTMDMIPYFLGGQSYVTYTKTCPVSFWGQAKLPMVIHWKTICFYEYHSYQYDLEEAEEVLQQRFLVFCKKISEKGIQIINKNVIILEGKNAYSMEGEVSYLYPATTLQPGSIPDLE